MQTTRVQYPNEVIRAPVGRSTGNFKIDEDVSHGLFNSIREKILLANWLFEWIELGQIKEIPDLSNGARFA